MPTLRAVILLIDADAVACRVTTALLTRLRYPHAVAQSGAEALDAVLRRPTDLLITELHLPDLPGLDLVEQLMLKPYLQDLPVMVCTAHATAETVERALSLGCVDFVKKPIHVDAFAGRLDRALRRAPVRWEPWRALSRRLRVDSRTFHPLLVLAREPLAELVHTLSRVRDGRAGDVGPEELAGRVRRVRSAALNVGAVRTVQLVDFLWSGRATADATAEDVADLHAALRIELSAFDQALQSRSTQAFAAPGAGG